MRAGKEPVDIYFSAYAQQPTVRLLVSPFPTIFHFRLLPLSQFCLFLPFLHRCTFFLSSSLPRSLSDLSPFLFSSTALEPHFSGLTRAHACTSLQSCIKYHFLFIPLFFPPLSFPFFYTYDWFFILFSVLFYFLPLLHAILSYFCGPLILCCPRPAYSYGLLDQFAARNFVFLTKKHERLKKFAEFL